MTLAELILWGKLKNREITKVKFRRQHPINFFIVDFYCHEAKLVIEVDGEIHNNDKSEEYDLNRTAEIEKYGIRIIRFRNEDVINNVNLVITKIIGAIAELTPL